MPSANSNQVKRRLPRTRRGRKVFKMVSSDTIVFFGHSDLGLDQTSMKGGAGWAADESLKGISAAHKKDS